MSAAAPPLVTVVVPTRQRPRLVVRAVESALAQTLAPIEVLVVLDGPDPGTSAALRALGDGRLRLEVLPRASGIGAARNAGVRAARGSWIAFLDDDDEWAPEKLAVQHAAAAGTACARPIVACRVAARDGLGPDRVWPRRLPAPGEPLGDYLFLRRTPWWGDTLLQTSTLLVPRELARAVPFDETLAKHEDLDWLLRATRMPGAAVLFAPAPGPLAVWHTEASRPRASTVPDWRASLAWIRSRAAAVSPAAYAGFCLAWIAADAARERSLEALWRLPWEACRRGRPRMLDALVFLGIWVAPARLRARLGRPRGDRA